MKTSELIQALAADAPQPTPSVGRRAALAIFIGGAASLALFMAAIGMRPDIRAAALTVRFQLKFLDSFLLALPSILLCWRLARPDAKPRALLAALAAPAVVLAISVVAELALIPRDEWMKKLVGSNAMHCLTLIPLLSIPPLGALLSALRAGAPANPMLSGAMAGAASAGVAAMIYATNCTDDSPLFVASWYPLASLIVIGAGALAGRRWLQW